MWNYNSGQVISILEQQSNEISCLCWVKHSGVKRPIVGVCWGKSTLFWPDVGAESSIEALSIEANDADVVTATAGTVKTSLVVTGSADGVVMIWDVHKMKPTVGLAAPLLCKVLIAINCKMKITLPRDPRPPLMKEQNNQRFVPDSPRSYHRLRQRRRLSGTVVEQIVLVDNDNVGVHLLLACAFMTVRDSDCCDIDWLWPASCLLPILRQAFCARRRQRRSISACCCGPIAFSLVCRRYGWISDTC